MNLADDVNFKLYQQLLKDKDWYEDHKGKYLAIVEGIIVGIDENRKLLLSKIRLEHPNKLRFFTQIDKEIKVFDVPSALEVRSTGDDAASLNCFN